MLPTQPDKNHNKKEDGYGLILKRIAQTVAGISLVLGGIYILGKSFRVIGNFILDVKHFAKAIKA